MIALICFFPVLVTTVDGLAAVDPDQLKLLRTLDASRWQAFRLAELPAALPAALSGARIALAVGVIGAFIAETSTPTSGPYPGLGREIITDVNFQTSRAYAGTVVLFGFAIACFYGLSLAERKLATPSLPPRFIFCLFCEGHPAFALVSCEKADGPRTGRLSRRGRVVTARATDSRGAASASTRAPQPSKLTPEPRG